MPLFPNRRPIPPRWLLAALAVLLAFPAVLAVQCQRIPHADERTMQALAEWGDAELQRRYGPPNPQAWRDATELWKKSTSPKPPELDRLTGAAYYAPALEPDFDRVAGPLNEAADALTHAAQRGTAYASIADLLAPVAPSATGTDWQTRPDLVALQSLPIWERTLASRAIAQGQWDAALDHLGRIALWQRGLAALCETNNLFAMTLQAFACRAYDGFLQSDAPPEALLRAADGVRALRLGAPRRDALSALVSEALVVRYIREVEPRGNAPRSFTVDRGLFDGTANALAGRRAVLGDAGLRRWAERRANFMQTRLSWRDIPGFIDPRIAIVDLSFTTIPAQRKFVLGCLVHEPAAVAAATAPGLPADLAASLDPYTVLAMTQDRFASPDAETEVRKRMAGLRLRATEAALRARYLHDTTGRWPETLAEIDAAFPPAEAGDGGAPPLALDWIDMATNPDLCAALWGIPGVPLLHNADILGSSIPDTPIGTGEPLPTGRYRAKFVEHEKAILPVAYAQALLRHPRLAESAKAQYLFRPRGNEKSPDRRPLTEAFARAVTDYWTEKNRPQQERGLRTSARTPDVLAETDYRLPESYELDAHLVAPDRVLVVHAAGPDGVDRGGTVSYDPTNGTRSAGDILAFPERF